MMNATRISPEVGTAISSFMRRQHRFVTFKMSTDHQYIVVDKLSSVDATFNEFVEDMHSAEKRREGRYAVLHYVLPDGDSKICFVTWIPNSLSARTKMLYKSNRDDMKKMVVGIYFDIDATDEGDLMEKSFIEKATKHK